MCSSARVSRRRRSIPRSGRTSSGPERSCRGERRHQLPQPVAHQPPFPGRHLVHPVDQHQPLTGPQHPVHPALRHQPDQPPRRVVEELLGPGQRRVRVPAQPHDQRHQAVPRRQPVGERLTRRRHGQPVQQRRLARPRLTPHQRAVGVADGGLDPQRAVTAVDVRAEPAVEPRAGAAAVLVGDAQAQVGHAQRQLRPVPHGQAEQLQPVQGVADVAQVLVAELLVGLRAGRGVQAGARQPGQHVLQQRGLLRGAPQHLGQRARLELGQVPDHLDEVPARLVQRDLVQAGRLLGQPGVADERRAHPAGQQLGVGVGGQQRLVGQVQFTQCVDHGVQRGRGLTRGQRRELARQQRFELVAHLMSDSLDQVIQSGALAHRRQLLRGQRGQRRRAVTRLAPPCQPGLHRVLRHRLAELAGRRLQNGDGALPVLPADRFEQGRTPGNRSYG